MTTESPKRIQRKRTKGWRMPEGAVYVGRPTIYGNPFWHVEKWHGRDVALRLYAETARGGWNPTLIPPHWPDAYVGQVYDDAMRWLSQFHGDRDRYIADLRGRDLACWCPLDQPCHADVLLELANR